MPSTKYDLLQKQIDSINEKLDLFESQFNQIKESLSLFDHFKEVLKNVPIENINERLDILEKNINERAIEMEIYEKISILRMKIDALEKSINVNEGISPEEYFKDIDKDPHFIHGDKLVDHEGRVTKPIERPIIEPETIMYR